MEKKIYSNWTTSTTNGNEALLGLLSALNAGKNAWIEIRKNGDQAHPIKEKNPQLEDWRNWTMSYGVPKDTLQMSNHHYFNETEKELTYSYAACYGTREAVEHYFETGELSKGNFAGMGTCHPVKISDIAKYKGVSEAQLHRTWTTFWVPKSDIPYWKVSDIKEVFTVCYNDEPVDKQLAIKRAGQFLMDYAEKLIGSNN